MKVRHGWTLTALRERQPINSDHFMKHKQVLLGVDVMKMYTIQFLITISHNIIFSTPKTKASAKFIDLAIGIKR